MNLDWSQHSGIRRLLIPVAAIVGAFALGLALGLVGKTYPVASTSSDLATAEKEIGRLAREVDVAQTRNAVDEAALEILRSEIAANKEEMAALEEGLLFYKGLMAPGDITQGLSLREIELVAREEGHFSFRIVAQQEARTHNTIKGELSAEVYGLQNSEQVSYPLAELSDDIEDNAITLRFRYFQSIEGVLVLPQDFEPLGIRVVARATSPRKAEVSEEFAWRVKERFTHVGK
jgi:Family of unknown function (DUF6776)